MSKIIVFGARGRLGSLVVAEAARRGHAVTAAVRGPATSGREGARDAGGGLPESVAVVGADATDAAAVTTAAVGHKAAVASLYQDVLPHDVFYASSTTALLAGLAEAGVGRLVVVGAAPNLEVSPGVRLMDTPGFPAEHLCFALGHTAALHVLRASTGPVDWLMLTPPMVFTPDAPATGTYRLGGDTVLRPPDDPTPLAYLDAATAIVDEATAPTRHHERAAIA
jgi:putative NADH-flavin reductase